MNDLDTTIGPALRERLRTEQPDLEHLAAASLRAGTRLRRRRQVSAVAGGAVGVAVLAVATSQLGGGTAAVDPDVADSTSAEPAPARVTVTAPAGESEGLPQGVPDTGLPVSVDVPGWTCESYPVDEKMWCTRGAEGLSVVVRGADSYDDWKGNPDKDGSALWMSPLHDNYFVTVQSGEVALGDAELTTFIDGMDFAATWQRP